MKTQWKIFELREVNTFDLWSGQDLTHTVSIEWFESTEFTSELAAMTALDEVNDSSVIVFEIKKVFV